MILFYLLIIPFFGAVASLAASTYSRMLGRSLALASMIVELIITISTWSICNSGGCQSGGWFLEARVHWFPQFGITLHFAIDGISLLLLMLTALLGCMAVIASWTEIQENVGFFHFNLLLTLSGVVGVFLALDLFVFCFFWELMLVPMYFLILSWGHEKRMYAAIKFFMYTQLGGLFLLVSILGLVFVHQRVTGSLSFDYTDLLGTSLSSRTGVLLLSGFLVAFLVKLPAIPFHAWLADAHTEAPTGGSIILAGLLLKTGAYGLIRFAVPLFPDAAAQLSPYGIALAVAGILYGASMAFAQRDLKRLIAYTSISHMGFVLLGISVWNDVAVHGAVVQMLCHGISTGALFMLAGALQERIHTRELYHMGGLWGQVPRMGALWLFFAMASLGLPGMGNFIGELLVLLGTYFTSATAAIIGTAGLIFAAVYALWMVWRILFGGGLTERKITDMTIREIVPLCLAAVILIWIGLFPQMVINLTGDRFFKNSAVAAGAQSAHQNSGNESTREGTGKNTAGLTLRGLYANR